ncbi:MAG: leucine-rich repeat protein [Clostridiales bacterium]|nr:leucine-rich repeat protein [Clostridiales bacterium]
MVQFTQRKCPTCGGRLEFLSGNAYECRCCHNVYEMNERNANLYHDLLDVSAARASLNFKFAEEKCKNLLTAFKDDNLADVYWNLLLCEQRVTFETDQNGEQFPSFYDIVSTDIRTSKYYAQMVKYLDEYDSQNKSKYEELVDKMYSAKRKYAKIKETTKPYDIFICFKKSKLDSEGGGDTSDYKIAYNLYKEFFKHYKVFFSEESLNNVVVREYEPNIYHALYTSKIMFVLCSKSEYMDSQWMKNEWSRFHAMSEIAAQPKSIIPVFIDGFTPENLPYELRSCQGYPNDMYLVQRLHSVVSKILNPVDSDAELAKMKSQVDALKQLLTNQSTTEKQNLTPKQPPQTKSVDTQQIEPVIQRNQPVGPQNYIVPYGTKEIRNEQFKNRTDLKVAIIPDTVSSIGASAFDGCTGLTDVTIPNSVRVIGSFAFSFCSKLTSINIPDGVAYIHRGAFCGCTGLTNIAISNSVTLIGKGAFAGCSELIKIAVADNNSKHHHNNNCIIETATRTLIAGCKTSIIPTNGSVTSIGESSFGGCTGLTNIVIPDNVTSICKDAFSGCIGLTSITIPNTIKTIGERAFEYCSTLTNITFTGTKKRWGKIKKYSNWNKSTGKYVIHCTDGDLKK